MRLSVVSQLVTINALSATPDASAAARIGRFMLGIIRPAYIESIIRQVVD